jgi:hypothetical protein
VSKARVSDKQVAWRLNLRSIVNGDRGHWQMTNQLGNYDIRMAQIKGLQRVKS